MKPVWRTYGWSGGGYGSWIDDLKETGAIRNALAREVRRLHDLAEAGRFYGSGGPGKGDPIPDVQLEAIRSDLALWNDPRAVLFLLQHGNVHFLGTKTKARAIAAIEGLLAEVPA